MTLLYTNARKVDALGEAAGFWMRVAGDRIVATGVGSPEAAIGDEVIDCDGDLLTPGLIDIHCHGGGGASTEGGRDAIARILETHRAHGTTRSVLSLVAAPLEQLLATLNEIADLCADDPLLLGSHLEGPFLAPERRGAHDAQFLIEPDAATVQALLVAARGTLRQVTIAPELSGALAATEQFVKAGVHVAVGHTEADAGLSRAAFDRGASILTHAFNAMPGIHHRAPGPVVAAIGEQRVTLELVLDGLHVVPEVAKLLFTAAENRVAIVTDAMAAAGAADGDWQLGSLAVTVSGGLATLTGTGTIAGSTLTLDRALQIAVSEVGIPLEDATTALTLTPAHALGLDVSPPAPGAGTEYPPRSPLGKLAPGYAADAVLWSGDLAVRAVWGAGRRLA